MEDRNHERSQDNYNKYCEYIRTNNQGIFMCVSRGKMSEGLNFRDNLARACIVVGIPYLLVNDSRVNLKKTYLDKLHKESQERLLAQCGNDALLLARV